MRYLKKDPASPLIASALSYAKKTDRPKIRKQLLLEQKGFCAYSERYLKQTDETNIEHFDPRSKETPDDGYYNWYVVLPWFNSRKPKKIEPYLPILSPFSADLLQRIAYQNGIGIFQAINHEDEEAHNLVKFLKWDSYELYEDCQKHLQRIRFLRQNCTEAEFSTHLREHNEYLSFATALEIELGIDAMKFLSETK